MDGGIYFKKEWTGQVSLRRWYLSFILKQRVLERTGEQGQIKVCCLFTFRLGKIKKTEKTPSFGGAVGKRKPSHPIYVYSSTLDNNLAICLEHEGSFLYLL